MCGLFISSILSSALVLIQALPKSKIVICLTKFDYKSTTLWIVFSFVLDLIYYICNHINYKCYYLLYKHCTTHIGMQIYDKISSTSKQYLTQKSINKILLTASEHINSCIKFADDMVEQCCHFFSAIIAILIVLFYNLYIGLIMFALSTLMIFWNVILGKKANVLANNVSNSKENVSTIMHNVVEKKDLIRFYNLQAETKQKYLNSVDSLTSNYSSRGKIYSIKSYFTYGQLYAIITALSIWLAHQTHTNQLALSAYLIITPYLINIIEQVCYGYDLIYKLEEVMIPAAKIQSLLAMPSKEMSAKGSNNVDILSGNLIFNNISYTPTIENSNLPAIENISLSISPNSITLFCGDHFCGKRTLFSLLCRTCTPTSGTITMDEINIYDFDNNTYAHNFSHTCGNPTFYNESIMDNLKYSHCPQNKIYKLCKQLGIDKEILKLPHKYQTNLVREKNICSDFLIFMLGLARAILTGSEWIAIYRLPTSLTNCQLDKIKNALTNLKSKHSFLIFDHSDITKDICDQIWYIKNGKINNQGEFDGE